MGMTVRPGDVRCGAWFSGDRERALRYDAERAWRWVIAGLRQDEAAVRELQTQIVDCTGCSMAVTDYLTGVALAQLSAMYGNPAALDVAQNMLVEVLSIDAG